jgi:biopolymer transport protein ExbD
MRRHRSKDTRHGEISMNMAPMIDMVFMLLIFYAFCSRLKNAESVEMQLPKPEHSQAVNVVLEDRVLIHCRPADLARPEGEVLYSAGVNPPESLDRISQRLAAVKAAVPDVKVVIRADRRVRFAAVRAVMQIVADNQIERMNLVAMAAERE